MYAKWFDTVPGAPYAFCGLAELSRASAAASLPASCGAGFIATSGFGWQPRAATAARLKARQRMVADYAGSHGDRARRLVIPRDVPPNFREIARNPQPDALRGREVTLDRSSSFLTENARL